MFRAELVLGWFLSQVRPLQQTVWYWPDLFTTRIPVLDLTGASTPLLRFQISIVSGSIARLMGRVYVIDVEYAPDVGKLVYIEGVLGVLRWCRRNVNKPTVIEFQSYSLSKLHYIICSNIFKLLNCREIMKFRPKTFGKRILSYELMAVSRTWIINLRMVLCP